MACCAAAALIIYHVLSIHKKLDVFRLTIKRPEVSAATQGEPEPLSKNASCSFKIAGMSCPACAISITKALDSRIGVSRVDVSLELLRARIAYDPTLISPWALGQSIKDLGYDAIEADEAESWAAQYAAAASSRENEIVQLKLNMRHAAYATGIAAVSSYLASKFSNNSILLWAAAISCVYATVRCCWTIHMEAWKSALQGRLDMSTLTSVALLCGLLQSDLAALSYGPRAASFDFVALLATVIIGGRFAKALISRQASHATASLASLLPKFSLLIPFKNGISQPPITIPADMIRVGDRILLNPGDSVPADGIVFHGESSILELYLRGETTPVTKRIGDAAYAGCVNQERPLEICITRANNDTWLQRALESTIRTSHTKDILPVTAEVLAEYFVQFVLIAAACVGIVAWNVEHLDFLGCLGRISTVLLCACPCAMGLSVPICISTASTVASQELILLNGGSSSLDKAADIDVVIFDKTGTLTVGVISVINHYQPEDLRSCLQASVNFWDMLARLERNVKHPIGRALETRAKKELETLAQKFEINSQVVSLHDICVHAGLGISGKMKLHVSDDESHVQVGSLGFMQSSGVIPSSECQEWIELQEKNFSANIGHVFVALDGKVIACFSLGDQMRPNAKEVVSRCKERGLAVGMITGDSLSAAEAVGDSLGISKDWIWAGVLPADKAGIVEKICENRRVAMVGDNINDLPALSASSFGIAIQSDSSVLDNNSADALILSGSNREFSLTKVLFLFDLAKRTRHLMIENLIWAFGYNLIAISWSTGILKTMGFGYELTPLLASIGMSCSSIVVLLNSMRLSVR